MNLIKEASIKPNRIMAQNNNNDNVHDNIGKINIKTSLKALEDDAGNPKPLTSTIHQIGGLSWLII